MKNIIASETEGYVKVCSLNELSENIGKRFYIDGTDIAIYKLKGEVYAVNNICPHQRSALMYDGFIENGCVVCPVHGWMFSLETGRTPSGVGRLGIYETAVIDNGVYVKVNKKDYTW
jgi:nitrite reductase/ring-hydroxylating ferredoxin subunit